MSLLDKASLILVPGAPQKASEIFAAKPVTESAGITRGTSAFRTRADGLLALESANIARLDYRYAGDLQDCPFWLVENAATNLVFRSQDFDNPYWTLDGAAITPNASVAPDGTMSADRIIESATTNPHQIISTSVTVFGGVARAFSVFVKKGTCRYIQIANVAFGDSSASAIFDLDTGVRTDARASSGSGPLFGFVDAYVEYYGNGVLRLVLVNTTSFDTPTYRIAHSNTASFSGATLINGMVSYTGDGTSFTGIWGAQVELGSEATSYITTTNAAATRNADVITESGLSAYIGQTNGAVAGKFVVDGSGVRSISLISDGTANNAFYTYLDANNRLNTEVYVAGFLIASEQSGVLSSGVHSYCFTYGSILTLYVDGIQGAGDTMSSVPACSAVRFGSQIGNVDFINGHIGAHVFFADTVTSAQAIQLSLIS